MVHRGAAEASETPSGGRNGDCTGKREDSMAADRGGWPHAQHWEDATGVRCDSRLSAGPMDCGKSHSIRAWGMCAERRELRLRTDRTRMCTRLGDANRHGNG